MTTAQALENITDSAHFEKLASAALRKLYPELSQLFESGINAKGETIPGPVDSFCATNADNFSLIQYTINDSNLDRKWLNEDSSGKRLDGDLIKGIKLARQIRAELPNTNFHIYLVTNHRVEPRLLSKILSKISDDFVQVTVVEQTILSDFLDTNPEGQYIRKRFLHIEAERLSKSLLTDLMSENQRQYNAEYLLSLSPIAETSNANTILLNIQTTDKKITLLVGKSGFGKSTIAYLLGQSYLKADRNVLRIDPAIVKHSVTLLDAIEQQLQKHQTKLYTERKRTKELFSKATLLIVDDLNREDNPNAVLDRLISWAAEQKKQQHSAIHILCPVLPKNMSSIQNKQKVQDLLNVIPIEELTKPDALTLIRQNIDRSVPISQHQANALIRDSARDPFLLSLFIYRINVTGGYAPSEGQRIISDYISGILEEISRNGSLPAVKYTSALIQLGNEMMRSKELNPSYDIVDRWFFSNRGTVDILGAIASDQRLFHVTSNGILSFRHDRIRDMILVEAIQIMLSNIPQNIYVLEDPFFSEIVGSAMAKTEIDEIGMELLLKHNPLAVFYSLKYIQTQENSQVFEARLAQIEKWKARYEPGKPLKAELKAIVWALLNFDTKEVEKIANGLPEGFDLDLARFRSGDCLAGLRFFCRSNWFAPSWRHYWRDLVIEHVRSNHLPKVAETLVTFFDQQILTEKGIQSGYLISGYLKSSRLIESLQKNWAASKSDENFIYYMWAILNCFSEEEVSVLEEAIEYWTQMSDVPLKPQYNTGGPKTLVVTELARCEWRFSEEQIKLLASLSEKEAFSKLVCGVLSSIDSPIAIAAVLGAFLRGQRRRDTQIFAKGFLIDRWEITDNGRKGSSESRKFLMSIWKNQHAAHDERYITFRAWCNMEEPECVLTETRLITEDDHALYDSAIFVRSVLRDREVASKFEKYLKVKPYGVRLIGNIWSIELKPAFQSFFEDALDSGGGAFLEDGIEALMDIDERHAEELLIQYWERIKRHPSAIATALYISTEKSRKLSRELIDSLGYNCWERIGEYYSSCLKTNGTFQLDDDGLTPLEKTNAQLLAEAFSYVNYRYGCMDSNRYQSISLMKLHSLAPYFKLLDESCLDDFAHLCRKLGYNDFLERVLQQYLSPEQKRKFLPSDLDIITELEEVPVLKEEEVLSSLVKGLPQRGVQVSRFRGILEKLFEKHKSVATLRTVCICMELVGTRQDIPIIQQYDAVDNPEEAADIKSNSIYRIKYNSLR